MDLSLHSILILDANLEALTSFSTVQDDPSKAEEESSRTCWSIRRQAYCTSVVVPQASLVLPEVGVGPVHPDDVPSLGAWGGGGTR